MTAYARWSVLIAAFLGWHFAGFQLAITSQAMRSAAVDVLQRNGTIDSVRYETITRTLAASGKNADPRKVLPPEDADAISRWRGAINQWFAWYTCALMLGASVGGLFFGRIGDRFGRTRALAFSILCYSVFSGLTCYVQTPEQLLILRFLACLGVGGTWPNGVALVSEVWVNMSRPLVAGVIGTAANIGIFLFATLTTFPEYNISAADWRWVMKLGAWPGLLGIWTLFGVIESPLWLSRMKQAASDGQNRDAADSSDQNSDPPSVPPANVSESVFRSPHLKFTILGIALAGIPLIGGWGSANWMVPWAGQVAELQTPPLKSLEAEVGQARSLTGIVGSLLGGWIASVLGRRRSYFLISILALFCAQIPFWFLSPADPTFLAWVAALGFFSGIYFGWLPLCLPELFPVRVRSTGAGVSFNFGRILTALTLFITGALQSWFQGDYARMGRVTSLIFAFGLVLAFFIPDTRNRKLSD